MELVLKLFSLLSLCIFFYTFAAFCAKMYAKNNITRGHTILMAISATAFIFLQWM